MEKIISKNKYKEQGYLLCKQVFDKQKIISIYNDINNLYQMQFDNLNISEGSFDDKLIKLFQSDTQRYIHINRTATMLSSIYDLAYDAKIINKLNDIGLKNPILCQKPTLRMDCKSLAITKEYYQLPMHQDYRAMQGSINSVVASIPLVDVDESLGALMVEPESHKQGLLDISADLDLKSQLEAIQAIEIKKENNKLISINQEIGDILIISSFLIHKSGENIRNTPRYTILVRYNDLSDEHFINKGFPSPFKMTHENHIKQLNDLNHTVKEYFN